MHRGNRLFLQLIAVLLAIQVPLVCTASRYIDIIGENIGPREAHLARAQSLDDVISPKLPDAYRDFITLRLFADADYSKPVADNERFISKYTWRDLELFPHLFDALNRTVTVFGRSALSGMLTAPQPVTDIAELKRRQDVIKLLRQDANLRKALQFLLQRLQKAEEVLLLFHMDELGNRKSVLRNYYMPRVLDFLGHESFFDKFYNWIDSTPSTNFMTGSVERLVRLLEFTHMIDTAYLAKGWLYNPVRNFFFPNSQGALQDQAEAGWSKARSDAQNQADRQTMASGIAGIAEVGGRRSVDGLRGIGSFTKRIQEIIYLPFAPIKYYEDMKMLVGVHRVLHGDLIRLATAVNSLHTASRCLRNLGVDKIVPECAGFFSLLQTPGQVPEFKQLLDILKTPTFKGTANSWSVFGHYGRMFAANHLMERTKNVWAKLFEAIGYIDAYLSIATLMDEYEEKGVKFCYPEYVAADQPVLDLQGFWNPVVTLNPAYRNTNLNNVITNNLTFGRNENNIMLTGPNAGGKSTIVRAVGHCVFLAQTLGVAPAESMRRTPFTMLNTAMNLRDSQAEGLSGFKTELDTACNYLMHKVGHTVECLKCKSRYPVETTDVTKPCPNPACKITAWTKPLQKNQFVLNLFDELFRATSQQDAQNTLYRFAKKFSKPNMLTIYATHNHGDLIVGLEQEQQGRFTNYCVEAPDGEHPDFKLKRGFSRQSVAKKLWQDYGLEPAAAA